jgi:hypothetical protein
MELFVQVTDNGMHMHAKIQSLINVDICKQIFLYLSSYNFAQEFTA